MIDRAVRSIFDCGYARVTLSDVQAQLLHGALSKCREFFAMPIENKMRHASGDFNFGYRPMGREYSSTVDRPDLNDCFTLWSDRTDLITHSEEIESLTTAMLRWRDCAAEVVGDVGAAIAHQFSGALPPFRAASHLQVNHYRATKFDRDLLQDCHEDGNLMTVIHADAPGLELLVDGRPVPAETCRDEIILMPGSVLQDLTGGRIAPLDHCVRNLQQGERTSMMYFVNPELNDPVFPWVYHESMPAPDLRDRIRGNPSAYGLPDVPVL
ncbi:isopenicillin N synthase family oxygenase [Nocardia arthritidis]|uniref:isopenicillin N synthase family oxygenase n=1 Tax=Nocardia arthritidis TaxID=228602 RepID=UPI00142E6E0E|nr:isopenicillin N synthase family oxygenase [Nocardia arthritidis]